MIDALKTQKFWIMSIVDNIWKDGRTKAILVFSSPQEAGAEADRLRVSIRKQGGSDKVKAKGIMILM